MNNSEIIAIVAIAATLISTVVSGLVVIFTTRFTNMAKRSEIAFSERLKAFEKVCEIISNVDSKLNLFQHTFEGRDCSEYFEYNKILTNDRETSQRKARAEVMRRLDMIDSGFMSSYNQYRVYIPPHIDREILKYYKEVLEPTGTKTIGEIVQSVTAMKSAQNRYSEKIITDIHKFIGFK